MEWGMMDWIVVGLLGAGAAYLIVRVSGFLWDLF
jgi:hypothetical protein